jgi:hypothetical protein
MAERRLRQVKAVAGSGEAADLRHGRDQPKVPDFEIHGYEATSSS